MLAVNHSDAVPFVGRDLSALILGQADPASVNDPVYYMTDDDPTRGLHMKRRNGGATTRSTSRITWRR